MVALKIFDVLLQASHVYTVHNTVITWLKGQHACTYTVAYMLLEHHCYSYKDINYNNIYYNLCAPTDDIPFIDVLLVVHRVSVI